MKKVLITLAISFIFACSLANETDNDQPKACIQENHKVEFCTETIKDWRQVYDFCDAKINDKYPQNNMFKNQEECKAWIKDYCKCFE